MLNIKRIVIGPISTNTYVVYKEGKKECIVIDCGGEIKPILDYVNENDLQVKVLLNTHGHDDHICGNRDIRELTGCIVMVSDKDADMLIHTKDTFGLLKKFGGSENLKADNFFYENDVINIDGVSLRVIETPGHTKGSVSFVSDEDKVVFTGDTLFKRGVGRTDFEYSNEKDLWHSIFDKLFLLADDYVVYPGHNGQTTIGAEKAIY